MKNITLTPERRDALCRLVQQKFQTGFDEALSQYQAEEIVDLMLKAMGPALVQSGGAGRAGAFAGQAG